MSKNNGYSLRAGGNIAPCSIAKWDATADEQCLQASANTDNLVGIVDQEGQRGTPGLAGSDTTIAYTIGQKVPIVGYGNDCLVQLGAVGCTAGDLLTADANGLGLTTAAGAGKVAVGMAMQTVTAGGKVRAIAIPPRLS